MKSQRFTNGCTVAGLAGLVCEMQSPKTSKSKQCIGCIRYLCSALFLYLLLLLLLLMHINNATTENTHKNDYYTAGVVEFRPSMVGMSSADMIADHLKSYKEIMESKEAEDIDIIVFPEGTLNGDFHLTYVPSEKQNIIPCQDNPNGIYSDFLVELSCTARNVRKYLVVNLSEKDDCLADTLDPRPCAGNGLNIYNTNVVFDRQGRVISRYRKVNIYVENKNTTFQPEFGIFETDFGVTFGHFICFDILFYTPAQELVDHYNLTHFIFTSFFYSELPFLTGTQLQFGWAWGNNVNLLAAGASNPQAGTTGTGIYAGEGGALISTMIQGEGERKLYKARVKKNSSSMPITQVNKNVDEAIKEENSLTTNYHLSLGIKLLKDPQIGNYNSVLLNLTKSFTTIHQQQLCFQDLCCSFDIETDFVATPILNGNHYFYRIGVFSGRRTYEKEAWSDIKVCALYTCASENIDSCGESLDGGKFPDSDVIFRKVHIKGKFPSSKKLLIMPSTIDYQLNPLEENQMQWHKKQMGSFFEIDFNLVKAHNNLMTFGIYAMYYE